MKILLEESTRRRGVRGRKAIDSDEWGWGRKKKK